MNTQLFQKLTLVVGVSFAGLALLTTIQEPSSSLDPAIAAEADRLIFQADPNDLQACGYYEQVRHFHTVQPIVATSPAPDPNAAAPTSTPRPAPSEDRVGFPKNYATDYKLLFIFDRPDRRWLRVICGNDIAAQREPGKPFAYGSVLLMITYAAQLDTDGQPVLDENGQYIGANLVVLHVQRKEEGFGEAYGADRSGEWEYMAYHLDGSIQTPPQNTNSCAVCHLNEAGEAQDFVFRMNLYHEGAAALNAPPVSDNEVSIYLYSFHEPVLEVKAGTTVTWINDDEATHTVVAAITDEAGKAIRAEEPLFESGVLTSANIAPGDSYSFTFDQPGEYLYRCTIHENMTGRIIVTE